jgi:hypothetical protein
VTGYSGLINETFCGRYPLDVSQRTLSSTALLPYLQRTSKPIARSQHITKTFEWVGISTHHTQSQHYRSCIFLIAPRPYDDRQIWPKHVADLSTKQCWYMLCHTAPSFLIEFTSTQRDEEYRSYKHYCSVIDRIKNDAIWDRSIQNLSHSGPPSNKPIKSSTCRITRRVRLCHFKSQL